MSLLTRDQAAEWPDPHVRDALLAGADLNQFCSQCIGALSADLPPDHAQCVGRSGHKPDDAACQCRCPMAVLHRWDRDESTDWDLDKVLAAWGTAMLARAERAEWLIDEQAKRRRAP